MHLGTTLLFPIVCGGSGQGRGASHLPLSCPNCTGRQASNLSISLGKTYLRIPEQDDHDHLGVKTQPFLPEHRQILLYAYSCEPRYFRSSTLEAFSHYIKVNVLLSGVKAFKTCTWQLGGFYLVSFWVTVNYRDLRSFPWPFPISTSYKHTRVRGMSCSCVL